MKNLDLKIVLKRVGAYMIDIIITICLATLITTIPVFNKKYQKYHRLYGLDEHDVRALEIQERTEREEERHYKAERKRMIREWDEVHRESKRW